MGSKLQRQDVEEPGISSPDTLKVRVEIALSKLKHRFKPTHRKDGLSCFLWTMKKLTLCDPWLEYPAGFGCMYQHQESTQSSVCPISMGCVRMEV